MPHTLDSPTQFTLNPIGKGSHVALVGPEQLQAREPRWQTGQQSFTPLGIRQGSGLDLDFQHETLGIDQ